MEIRALELTKIYYINEFNPIKGRQMLGAWNKLKFAAPNLYKANQQAKRLIRQYQMIDTVIEMYKE